MNLREALTVIARSSDPEIVEAAAVIKSDLIAICLVLDGVSAHDLERFSGATAEECARVYRLVNPS
jgi:hypothetical protein